MTLKNAAGLTLVGTFYDAGTLARRCCKPCRGLSRVFLWAQKCWGRRQKLTKYDVQCRKNNRVFCLTSLRCQAF